MCWGRAIVIVKETSAVKYWDNGSVPSGKGPRQLSFQTVKGKGLRSFLFLQTTTHKSSSEGDSGRPGSTLTWQPSWAFSSMENWFWRHEKCKTKGAMDLSSTISGNRWGRAKYDCAGACEKDLKGEETIVWSCGSQGWIAAVKQSFQNFQGQEMSAKEGFFIGSGTSPRGRHGSDKKAGGGTELSKPIVRLLGLQMCTWCPAVVLVLVHKPSELLTRSLHPIFDFFETGSLTGMELTK